jgi:hypothetical protein
MVARASRDHLLALAASALLACAVALVMSRKVTKERLRSAFWLVFALLGALACIAAPGASILIFPPPLVAAAGMIAGGKYERMIGLRRSPLSLPPVRDRCSIRSRRCSAMAAPGCSPHWRRSSSCRG